MRGSRPCPRATSAQSEGARGHMSLWQPRSRAVAAPLKWPSEQVAEAARACVCVGASGKVSGGGRVVRRRKNGGGRRHAWSAATVAAPCEQ